MSNTSQSKSQSARPHQCPKCAQSFVQQKAYYDHLRGHAMGDKSSRHDQTSDQSTADDTARYIAERRKNFPTTDNINKKMKSDEERQERGDVLETRQFGRMKERKTNPTRNIETKQIPPVAPTNVTNSTNSSATLLERLLALDIRRERNMVLQSIRHIVNNNFFGLDEH